MWYKKLDTYVLGLDFVRSIVDHCVYSKQIGNDFVIITLYVDDMLLIGNSKKIISVVKSVSTTI